MIIAQWTACVMLALTGWLLVIESVLESVPANGGSPSAGRLFAALSILAIAAAIAVRP